MLMFYYLILYYPLMKKALTLITGIYAFFSSCISGPSQSSQKSRLTPYEKHICDSLGIDSSIVLTIRAYTDSSIIPFPANLDNIPPRDSAANAAKEKLHGLLFNTDHALTDSIVNNLYNKLHSKGYTIFTYDDNFGISSQNDLVGILKSVNKYDILRRIQTDGINYNIDNDSLLKIIKKFDEKYSLQLTGAANDWCQFRINMPHIDWLQMAKEAYKVCPDIVDQGTGTVEKLADEMKRTRCLYFWWD